MKRSFSYLAYAGFILILSSAAWLFSTGTARATCGSANCFLVAGTQEGGIAPGQMILDLSYRFIPMDRAQSGSNKVSDAITPSIDFENGTIEPGHHREVRTNNELGEADITYGVLPSFSITMGIPFMNIRTHEHAEAGGGFSRQDGTSGFGDVRLTGRYVIWNGTRHLMVAGAGIKTPTGEYRLLNSDGVINEPSIMPGTGSWDGILSVYYTYHVRPSGLEAFFSGSYQITTENSLDYKFGDTLLLNGGLSHTAGLRDKTLTTSLQINMRQSPRDEFKGEEVLSTGGRWIYITPGIKIQAARDTAFYMHCQLPLYQYVHEENIVPRYGLILGVSYIY